MRADDLTEGVLATILARGWVSAAQVDGARAFEARLRELNRSPGLLAVVSRALAPTHLETLRAELEARGPEAAPHVSSLPPRAIADTAVVAPPDAPDEAPPIATTAWMMPVAKLSSGELQTIAPTARLAPVEPPTTGELAQPPRPLAPTAWQIPAATLPEGGIPSTAKMDQVVPEVRVAPTAGLSPKADPPPEPTS